MAALIPFRFRALIHFLRNAPLYKSGIFLCHCLSWSRILIICFAMSLFFDYQKSLTFNGTWYLISPHKPEPPPLPPSVCTNANSHTGHSAEPAVVTNEVRHTGQSILTFSFISLVTWSGLSSIVLLSSISLPWPAWSSVLVSWPLLPCKSLLARGLSCSRAGR